MISTTPYNQTHNKVSARLTRGKEVLLPFFSTFKHCVRIKHLHGRLKNNIYLYTYTIVQEAEPLLGGYMLL